MYQSDLQLIQDKMKVGSLFSGIGGIDIGFLQAGFEISWANEIDTAACKTYRHNIKDTRLIEGDIRELNPHTLERIDILTAGFPCQPFSVMGYQRGFVDPRGNLFFEILRFIDILHPRIVFLENVSNLIEHDNGKTFLVIYNTLAQLGYSVKYKIINAAEVNIPQNRARIFIVAFSDVSNCDCFSFPEPLPLNATIEDILNRSIAQNEIYYYTSDNRYFSQLNAKIVDKTGIYRIDDRGIATRKWDICPTLKANMGTYHDRVPIIRDDFGIRKLTLRECLDFQGFPKDFYFPNSITVNDAYKQTGNTVCIPVIKSIALKIKSALN